MNSKIFFLLAILCISLGVAFLFCDMPFLEKYPMFSSGFFQGFLIGLGSTLFVAAYLRRKKEREEGAATAKSCDRF